MCTVKVGAVSVFVPEDDTFVTGIVVGVETRGSFRMTIQKLFTTEDELATIDARGGFDGSEFHCDNSLSAV